MTRRNNEGDLRDRPPAAPRLSPRPDLPHAEEEGQGRRVEC